MFNLWWNKSFPLTLHAGINVEISLSAKQSHTLTYIYSHVPCMRGYMHQPVLLINSYTLTQLTTANGSHSGFTKKSRWLNKNDDEIRSCVYCHGSKYSSSITTHTHYIKINPIFSLNLQVLNTTSSPTTTPFLSLPLIFNTWIWIVEYQTNIANVFVSSFILMHFFLSLKTPSGEILQALQKYAFQKVCLSLSSQHA